MKAMILINFKTYKEGTGEEAVKLVKICAEVEKETGVPIIPVVQVIDIFRLASLGFKVWAQHVDEIEYGPNTGRILPEAVLVAGAEGTILNHSENKLPTEIIGETIEHCRQLGLEVLVCCESVEEGKEIAKFKPDFLAYEPSELIGGDVSVSSAKPAVIKDFVREIPGIPVVIGAGIHSSEDIRKGISFGALSFLVSSSVVLAKDPKAILLELAGGFR